MPDDDFYGDFEFIEPDEPDNIDDLWKIVQGWFGEDAANLPLNFIMPAGEYQQPELIRSHPFIDITDLLNYIGETGALPFTTILVDQDGTLMIAVSDSP